MTDKLKKMVVLERNKKRKEEGKYKKRCKKI